MFFHLPAKQIECSNFCLPRLRADFCADFCADIAPIFAQIFGAQILVQIIVQIFGAQIIARIFAQIFLRRFRALKIDVPEPRKNAKKICGKICGVSSRQHVTQSPLGPRTQGEHVSVHRGIFGPKGMLGFAPRFFEIKSSKNLLCEPLASTYCKM